MAEQKSDEEGGFVHITEKEMTEEDSLRCEIQKYKETHMALLNEIKRLAEQKQESESMASKIQDRVDKREKTLLENEAKLHEKEKAYQKCVTVLWEENAELVNKAQKIRDEIVHYEKETEKLEEICASGMERKVVFKGEISNTVPLNGLNVKHEIKYPVRGGTAMITFEDPSVAAKIIAKKYHEVKVEECWIHVEAEPVELLILDTLSMNMKISPKKILVSNLPQDVPIDIMLDKLELFFGKIRNGGGEIESVEFLSDSRTAILTFITEDVTPRLVGKHFDVQFGKVTHTVNVSPSLNGSLTDYKMKKLVCDRTVLITGIPEIMDADAQQDLLHIHFQKPRNDGGEVQALLYCAEGQHMVTALFEDDKEDLTQAQ